MMPRTRKAVLILTWSLLALSLITANALARQAQDHNIFLPLILQKYQGAVPTPPPGGEIQNPGFEAGMTGWTFYNPSGGEIISSGQAHGGSAAAHLGIYPAIVREGWIEQAVIVPADRPVLQYWRWVRSEEICAGETDWIAVFINGSRMEIDYLGEDCQAQMTWERQTLNLAGLAGQTITLRLWFSSDDSLASEVYLDDFAFVAP